MRRSLSRCPRVRQALPVRVSCARVGPTFARMPVVPPLRRRGTRTRAAAGREGNKQRDARSTRREVRDARPAAQGSRIFAPCGQGFAQDQWPGRLSREPSRARASLGSRGAPAMLRLCPRPCSLRARVSTVGESGTCPGGTAARYGRMRAGAQRRPRCTGGIAPRGGRRGSGIGDRVRSPGLRETHSRRRRDHRSRGTRICGRRLRVAACCQKKDQPTCVG